MRPIDEVAARERFYNNLAYMGTDVKRILATQPTINPDNLRECGRWIINPDGYYPYCSECKGEPKHGEMTKYCPNCGAKMDGKEQSDD